MDKKIHEGRNEKRFREMMGLKQEALAAELGDDWNQKKISMLEAKETVDLAVLQQVSQALNIPVEAFQNFDEEQAVNFISNNTFDNCAQPVAGTANYHECSFNPIDKMVELYERMLQQQKEIIEKLEQLIKGN